MGRNYYKLYTIYYILLPGLYHIYGQSTNQQPTQSTNQQPTQPTDQIQPLCMEPFIPQSPPSSPQFHSTRSKSQRSDKDLVTQFVRRSRRQKGLQPEAAKEVPPSTPRDYSSITQSSVTLPPPPVHIPPPLQTLPNSGNPPPTSTNLLSLMNNSKWGSFHCEILEMVEEVTYALT